MKIGDLVEIVNDPKFDGVYAEIVNITKSPFNYPQYDLIEVFSGKPIGKFTANNVKAATNFFNQSSGWDDDDVNKDLPELPKLKTCECGAWRVYGDDCAGREHADWCPMWRKSE